MITYPLALPTQAPWTRLSVVFRPHAVVAVVPSPFTLQQQVQAHAGQAWVVDVALLPMRRAEAEPWIAALLALNGREGTFHLGDPTATSPQGTGGGAPQVAGAGQSGQQLATDGWTPSQTVLKAGDWVQLGAGAQRRIYRVLQDVTSDLGGAATLDLWPRLREAPADNEPLVLTDTAGTFRMLDNEMVWSVDRALRYGLEFTAVEAL